MIARPSVLLGLGALHPAREDNRARGSAPELPAGDRFRRQPYKGTDTVQVMLFPATVQL